MSRLVVYDAPKGAVGIDHYKVHVRVPGEPWLDLFIYEVKVDMHQVRKAAMVYFDMEGLVEVRVESCNESIQQAVIRPLSSKVPFQQEEHAVNFLLDKPCKLVIEINGQRFSALHLFANPLESNIPDLNVESTLILPPRIHRTEDLYRLLQTPSEAEGKVPKILYFAPGMHYLEETLLRIPSGTTVYLAGGAVLVGAFVCEHVEDVTIRGRGIVYLSDFHRFSAFRGVRIVFSRRIIVEGITVIDPPHYSVYLGSSEHVQIRNFKAFSTRGWSDGIDIMACSHIDIDDIFMRNSDDCIAIYGTRWDYRGDTRYVTVRNSVLWADVAHPIMIGTHGDHHKDGDTIEDIYFNNIDILEHHEPQENYWGAMALNAGDLNTIRNVTFDDIRVEEFELGQLIDIRVVWNKDYNPVPGRQIENIIFRNVTYNGANTNPNRIYGYDEERSVENIRFENLHINGELILRPEQGNFVTNEYTRGVSFHQIEEEFCNESTIVSRSNL